jgi:replicative DNA helicase
MKTNALNYEIDVLATMMFMGADAYDKVCDHITADDFFDKRNQKLFAFCAKMIAKSEPIDHEIIIHGLEKSGRLESVGGIEHITHIMSTGVYSESNLTTKAKTIADYTSLRRLIAMCSNVIDGAKEFCGDLSAIMDYADNELSLIRNSSIKTKSELKHAKPLLAETIGNIEDRFNRGSALVGVDTGFPALNDVLLGLAPKDLVIVAAVPGMGKTTLAMNFVENALQSPTPPGAILFFSQEMGDTELMERILSSTGRINQTIIRKGALDEYHWNSLTAATSIIKDWPLYIDETNGLTPAEMRSRCKRMARQCGKIGMIVVDYLQLMTVKGMEDNEVAKLTIISSALKSLAKEMNCPVVALSQLSRKVMDRPNKRPINSDLRGSGSIEQDADVILFIYRDEVANKESDQKGIAEVIVNKHRKGALGTVLLGFEGQHSKFVNLAPSYNTKDF